MKNEEITPNKNAGTDVSVALIFFTRPDLLKVTFNAIRSAKPKKLYLIQDGPRNPNDIAKIKECRDIAENIDWPCEVLKNYSEVNLGCGRRIYTGLNWAFETTEEVIVIEDDCVPSVDFLQFCKEMFERYKHDNRIDMICGMNHLDVYNDTQYDYIFCNGGSIWGWATWKRSWKTVDYDMNFLKNTYFREIIKYKHGSGLIKIGDSLKQKLDSGQKLSSWSYQRGINQILNNGLSIVPKKNMIKNIGLNEESANSVSSINLIPRGLRRIYQLNLYSLNREIQHPPYVIPDERYDKFVNDIMGNSSKLQYYSRKLETGIYRILNGDVKGVLKKAKNLFNK